MAEVLFYHLERRTLDEALPALVARTLERGWKACIRVESPARAQAVDRLLWSYDEQSFLPHGLAEDPRADRQPALITQEDLIPNGANVLFVIGGAPPPPWDGTLLQSLTRVVLMFDGRDPAAVQSSREAWKGARAAGHTLTYWKENAEGKWEKQG